MMIRIFLMVFSLSIMWMSCNSKRPGIPVTEPASPRSFFPVTNFIMGQLHELDSLKVAPLKIVTQNGKCDSTWIKVEDIKAFAVPFLTPRIDSTNLLDQFNESSFMDQTINAITLTYTRSSHAFDTFHLRNWDVYIDPVKQTIQRIYMVKTEQLYNEFHTLQLTWKTGSWCKIVTIPQDSSQSHFVKEEIVKWNFDQ